MSPRIGTNRQTPQKTQPETLNLYYEKGKAVDIKNISLVYNLHWHYTFIKPDYLMKSADNWQHAKTDVFWGEIAPCEHVIQVYENDSVFLDTLAGFVGGGIHAGECVIVIATQNHLQSLYFRLASYALSVQELIEDDRYIPYDAEKVLDQFMVGGWPDEELFNKTISAIVERGTCRNRRIRAFGEMVALLWGRGDSGATVQLEHLWNKYCEQNKLTLFCAYPKVGFTNDINDSMQTLCACHSKIINGSEKQLTEIFYSEVGNRKAS